MKTLVLLFCLLLPTTALANGWRKINTMVEQTGLDDTLHFAAGAGLAYMVKKHSGLTGWKANVVAIAVPVMLGLAKEATDKRFNPGDVAGYAVGASLVILTF